MRDFESPFFLISNMAITLVNNELLTVFTSEISMNVYRALLLM